MAARFWRWTVGLALLLAAGVAATAQRTAALAPWSAAAVALATLAALPLIFVATSLGIARRGDRAGRGGAQLGRSAIALFSETVHFSVAVVRMCREPHPWTAGQRAAGRPPRPVLLIHGILCNRGVWRPLQRLLQRAGFSPVRAVNLEPLCASIERHAQRLGPELLGLQRECGGTPVLVVGHSMGGLVARLLLRQLGPQAIGRIVTVGSPHHGTVLTGKLRCPPARQMAPASAWLAALNGEQEDHFAVPVCSLYSLEDNLVAPARSAALRGAERRELRSIGHFGLLARRRALDAVMAALEATCGS